MVLNHNSIMSRLKGLLLVLALAAGLLGCPDAAYAFDTALDDQLLVLVNGKNLLAAAYTPSDLVDIAKQVPSQKSTMQLREPAAKAYQQMLAAYSAGHSDKLYAVSGFRDYAYQKQLFSSKVAGRQRSGQSYAAAYQNTLRYTALPGTSEHQTGLAIDLSNNAGLSESFRDTKQGQWLLENCWAHGFILRYDAAKSDVTAIAYEPWHYRYVGLPHSLILRDNDWVLEEYVAYLQDKGSLEYPDPLQPESLYKVYYTTDTTQEYDNIVSISSDNAGGYVITCHVSRLEQILTNWADIARSGDLDIVRPDPVQMQISQLN